MCGECNKQPAIVFCSRCEGALCAACDAEVHAGGLRKEHTRVPLTERPVFCTAHPQQQVKVFCVQEMRLACAECVARLVGVCAGHALKALDTAAAARRTDAERMLATITKNLATIDQERRRLQTLRTAIDTQDGQLATAARHDRIAEQGLEQLLAAQAHSRFLAAVEAEMARAADGAGRAAALVREGEEALRRLCSGVGAAGGKIEDCSAAHTMVADVHVSA